MLSEESTAMSLIGELDLLVRILEGIDQPTISAPEVKVAVERIVEAFDNEREMRSLTGSETKSRYVALSLPLTLDSGTTVTIKPSFISGSTLVGLHTKTMHSGGIGTCDRFRLLSWTMFLRERVRQTEAKR